MVDVRHDPISGGRQVDVTKLVDNGKFNRFSLSVAVICFLAIVFDGFDISLFGALLPAIMTGMNMGPADAGLLAGIGNIGAVGGAVIFGVAADTFGRKRMMVIGMTIFIVFTAACGLAQGFVDFAIYRFIAGFGLAGIVPIAVALVFEYTPGTRKATVSSLSYMGINVGVLLSAALAIALLPIFGWRAMLLGSFAGIILVIVAMLWLPESMSNLVKNGKTNTIRKILMKVDPKFVYHPDDEFVLSEPPAPRVPLKRLFQDGYRRNTLALGTAMFCLMMIAVTLTTWIAKLMIQRGFSQSMGITFIMVFASSVFVATPLVGWMTEKMGYKKVFAIFMPILFVSISLVGIVQSAFAALICMFCAGFAGMSATCLLLPYVGSLYPMSFRSTAMGVIYAIGRIGPIIGPAIVGAMIAVGISTPVIFVCMAAPSLVAMVAFLLAKEMPTALGGQLDPSSATRPLQVPAAGHGGTA